MSEINISLAPETVFSIGEFPVTNSFLSMVGISLFLIIVFTLIARRLQTVPGKGQFFIEMLVDGMYSFVKQTTGSERAARRLFPMFAVFALFFLVSNILGIVPGFGALLYKDASIWRPPTTDYGLIFALTFVMFITWQFVAIITGGLVNYAGKFFNFSGFKEGVLNGVITFAVGLLDIIGEIAKIISLSFRLFGNIFAGEAIFAVLIGLFSFTPYVIPLPFVVLSTFSGIIQAFVFPLLVLIFITMSIETRDGTDEQQKSDVQHAPASTN